MSHPNSETIVTAPKVLKRQLKKIMYCLVILAFSRIRQIVYFQIDREAAYIPQ